MAIEMSSYYLSRHTFFCLADNHYVFLDLRKDEYLCLGRSHTDAVKELLNGHHVIDNRSADIRLHDASQLNSFAVIQALLNKGLLVENRAYGKPATPTRVVHTPLASTMDVSDTPRFRIRPTHIWNFFAAAAAASKHLRWGSIENTIRTVEGRKLAHSTVTTAVDKDVITGLFEIFQTLRPYYPRPYLCLFDSLALLHFLARYQVFPQWVYGVKLEPFAAHCWVQVGDLVVNDIVDNVRDYTPIMCV
jgi:hypothetical protein